MFACLHEFVDGKLLRVPRQQWMDAFEYWGRGSTRSRAKVIQTIYDASLPFLGLRSARIRSNFFARFGCWCMRLDVANEVWMSANSHKRKSGYVVQQRLCVLEVRRVEALGEPAIDWCEEVHGLGPPALSESEPR